MKLSVRAQNILVCSFGFAPGVHGALVWSALQGARKQIAATVTWDQLIRARHCGSVLAHEIADWASIERPSHECACRICGRTLSDR